MAFAVVLGLWLMGEAPARALLPGLGDLAFAAVFTGWLLASRSGR